MTHLDLDKIHDGVGRMLYKGVAAWKFPFDYVMYQMIIHEVRPDLIIEIGTMHGGSALYLADLLEVEKIDGAEVHTIDIIDPYQRREYDSKLEDHKPNPFEHLNYPEIVASHPRIKTFSGGYQSYDLSNCEGFKNILIIDDGSHNSKDVLKALNKFKHLVNIGSYYIIEDGNALDVYPNKDQIKGFEGGPLKAIYEFLSKNDDFRVDYRWCDMFGINSTFNTYGYLKRVK